MHLFTSGTNREMRASVEHWGRDAEENDTQMKVDLKRQKQKSVIRE